MAASCRLPAAGATVLPDTLKITDNQQPTSESCINYRLNRFPVNPPGASSGRDCWETLSKSAPQTPQLCRFFFAFSFFSPSLRARLNAVTSSQRQTERPLPPCTFKIKWAQCRVSLFFFFLFRPCEIATLVGSISALLLELWGYFRFRGITTSGAFLPSNQIARLHTSCVTFCVLWRGDLNDFRFLKMPHLQPELQKVLLFFLGEFPGRFTPKLCSPDADQTKRCVCFFSDRIQRNTIQRGSWCSLSYINIILQKKQNPLYFNFPSKLHIIPSWQHLSITDTAANIKRWSWSRREDPVAVRKEATRWQSLHVRSATLRTIHWNQHPLSSSVPV